MWDIQVLLKYKKSSRCFVILYLCINYHLANAQLKEGHGVALPFESVTTNNLYKLSDILDSDTRADFNSIISEGNISSITRSIYHIPTINDSIDILTVRLTGAAPAVIQRSFVFLRTKDLIAYANVDTLLVNAKSKTPLIMLTSLKGKFFMQKASIAGRKVKNYALQKVWENYADDECNLFTVNNVGLATHKKRSCVILKVKNICNPNETEVLIGL